MGFRTVVLRTVPLFICLLLRSVFADAGLDEAEEEYLLDETYADSFVQDANAGLVDDFGYGTDTLEEYAGYGEDNFFYYNDEFEEYYNTYGVYADEYGYDYFDTENSQQDCTENASGEAKVSEDVCDVKLSGVDQALSKDLPGGIDGEYKLAGCFEGLPKYKRTGKTASDTRLMWKSTVFNDWDISIGEKVNVAQAIVYGTNTGLETRPNFLQPEEWRLMSQFAKDESKKSTEYMQVNITIKCVDDKVLTPPKKLVSQPVLTDDESDANYRAVYQRYGRSDPDPAVNFFLVILMVALGASVVMGLPHLLKTRRSNGRQTLGQMLENARKQRQGHVN